MKKLIQISISICFLISCSSNSEKKLSNKNYPNVIDGFYYHNLKPIKTDSTLKKINLGPFVLNTPHSWKFEKVQGIIDSYVGKIVKDSIVFHFDYSNMGYSNKLSKDTFNQNIKTDTIPPYFVKVVTPKIGKLGQTGIYFKYLESSLTLNFYTADSLDSITQKEALGIINSIAIVVK